MDADTEEARAQASSGQLITRKQKPVAGHPTHHGPGSRPPSDAETPACTAHLPHSPTRNSRDGHLGLICVYRV